MNDSAALTERDYEEIEAAVRETSRGRWFLTEHTRRNRATDTQSVLDALHRMEERVVRSGGAEIPVKVREALSEMSRAISDAKTEVASAGEHHSISLASNELDAIVKATEIAASDILGAAERVQEKAWTMREQGVDDSLCDQLDFYATQIYTACSFQDITGQRTKKVVETLRFIEGRLNTLIDIWGDPEDDATGPMAPSGEPESTAMPPEPVLPASGKDDLSPDPEPAEIEEYRPERGDPTAQQADQPETGDDGAGFSPPPSSLILNLPNPARNQAVAPVLPVFSEDRESANAAAGDKPSPGDDIADAGDLEPAPDEMPDWTTTRGEGFASAPQEPTAETGSIEAEPAVSIPEEPVSDAAPGFIETQSAEPEPVPVPAEEPETAAPGDEESTGAEVSLKETTTGEDADLSDDSTGTREDNKSLAMDFADLIDDPGHQQAMFDLTRAIEAEIARSNGAGEGAGSLSAAQKPVGEPESDIDVEESAREGTGEPGDPDGPATPPPQAGLEQAPVSDQSDLSEQEQLRAAEEALDQAFAEADEEMGVAALREASFDNADTLASFVETAPSGEPVAEPPFDINESSGSIVKITTSAIHRWTNGRKIAFFS